jgi:hypothetical protein
MKMQVMGSTAWMIPRGVSVQSAGAVIGSFLDIASTSTGKATHYDTVEQIQRVELAAHAAMLRLDRCLYAALLLVPGVNDRAMQLGIRNLLGTTAERESDWLPAGIELAIVRRLVATLPPQRMLKVFATFATKAEGVARVNNARARKLVLRTLLDAPKLDLWAVKYRSKVARVLTHALGRRTAGIVRSILSKTDRSPKEAAILRRTIGRYVPELRKLETVYACVGFALGARPPAWEVELLRRFEAAKKDLSAGRDLPIEVLEGLRGTYHRDTPSSVVLELTKNTMSAGQRKAVQRKGTETGVEIAFDPTAHNALELYIYAFEMGMTDDIATALDLRASEAATSVPFRIDRATVLVDASRSMLGSETQRLRPMAAALALRDVLARLGRRVDVRHIGGITDGRLVRPNGDTSLARALLDALGDRPEVVFVISDGYENAPAGRFGEVMTVVRRIGVTTPVFHLNPVTAAEVVGVRQLAPGLVPTLPMSSPAGLGLGLTRQLVEIDPVEGVSALLSLTPLRKLEA